MSRSFCQDSDSQRGDSSGMEKDGTVVQVTQDVDAKGIDRAMGDEYGPHRCRLSCLQWVRSLI